MLKIRLTRLGKKNKAFYRVVVAEHTAPVKGRFIEALGFLNPHTKEKKLETDRLQYWLGKGAQCSDSVHNLLVKEGIVKGPKRAIKMRKKESGADTAEKKAPAPVKASSDAEAPEDKSDGSDKEKPDTSQKKEEKVEEPGKDEKKE